MSVAQIAAPLPAHAAENEQPAKCDVKYCRVCGHVLPSKARKCVKCTSWEGWRGWLPVTDASLSVVLAMISVLTVIVPPVLRFLARESFTRVAIVGVDDKDLQVAVSNVGRRPTVLRSYQVEFVGADFLPAMTLTPRNIKASLLMQEQHETVNLHGAAKVVLPVDRKEDLAAWIAEGTVKLTVCVKESGSGSGEPDAAADPGSCESRGLAARSDSIAAVHLQDWIEGQVQWKGATP